MKDGKSERKVLYEGKLVGDELRLTTRRRPTDKPTELVARRAPAGEGALPARIEPPALHKVKDNCLARTPPMGWNSWNKFAGRVDDAIVRSIAEAMATNGMKEAGYQYVTSTTPGRRTRSGQHPDEQEISEHESLADYVHRKGEAGHTHAGPDTCRATKAAMVTKNRTREPMQHGASTI